MGNGIEIRRMRLVDIQAGMRLRELAGWNQTDRDWTRFLEFEPEGCFAATKEEKVCGTVATLRYGRRLGWIGMLLVDPEYRHQGIGTQLLDRSLSHLRQQRIETIKLDATPAGRSLYIGEGFVDEFEIERWEGVAAARQGPGLQQISERDIRRICGLDEEMFGADRSRLLRTLWQEQPQYSAAVYSDGDVAGYILGRAGSRAHTLGPWVAGDNRDIAEELLTEILNRLDGERVFVDICLENAIAARIMNAFGFRPQRKLTRMYHGPNKHPGRPDMICAIAGPELG